MLSFGDELTKEFRTQYKEHQFDDGFHPNFTADGPRGAMLSLNGEPVPVVVQNPEFYKETLMKAIPREHHEHHN